MPLLLSDRAQIDPKTVWLRVGSANEDLELYLVHRDTEELVSEGLPYGCGMLPYPLQGWFNQQRGGWGFRPPADMPEEEALRIARASGFRKDLDDVNENGDPGYLPQQVARRDKVVSARRRLGCPGEEPVTVIMALAAEVDANGFTKFNCLTPEELPKTPKLHEDCTEEIFLSDAMPEDVISAWRAEGYIERPDVIGCFEPSELYAWVSEPDEDGMMEFSVTPREACWMDDDLRDHSLTIMPAAIGANLAENTWEVRSGVTHDEAWSEVLAAGYVKMPEDLRRLFGG